MTEALTDLLRSLTLLDVLVGLIALLALARGYRRGALSQVMVFGGALLGLLVGAIGGPALARQIMEGPGPALALTTLAVLLASVLIGQAIGAVIGSRLRAAARRAGVGWFDRAVGMLLGLAGLVVVVWLLAGMLVQGPSPRLAQAIEDSALAGVLDETLPPPPDVVGGVAGYLNDQGFPQVVSGLAGGVAAPPIDPASDASAQAAAEAGQPSTVQVRARGCGQQSSGSGFVTEPGFVVTNAHVIAGADSIEVRATSGSAAGRTVLFDPALDLAVLRVEGLDAPPLGWAEEPAGRGVEGATLGFPGGQQEMVVKPATVAARADVTGRDIYGGGGAQRQVLTLAGAQQGVQRGDSGGPFVTAEGAVGGVVFAANAADPSQGYALSAERVRDPVTDAIAANEPSGTGSCRY